MPDALTSPATMQAISAEALRVVLFGMPDAGKSSLLAALAQAAQTQEHVLNGHLSDLSQGLGELRRQVYEEQPRSSLGEVIPFPVVFEPFVAGRARSAERFDAVLIDCEGQKAIDVMTRWRTFGPHHPAGALGQAILDADAVVLTVDASATAAQVESDFAEFSRFLSALEQGRGQRAEVGGLPIFLVLTKCDLLAQAQDDPATWMERIEERKGQVGQRFQEFLERGASGFGSIQLNLWATAIKRPALREAPAKPREPYGVAELFRQCFAQAAEYRERCGRAGFRLFVTVIGTFAAVAALATLAVVLVLNRPSPETAALEQAIDRYRSREHDQSVQVRHRNVPMRIDELTAIKEQPAYGRISRAKQEYVEGRLRELTAFEEFEKRLEEAPGVTTLRDADTLHTLRAALAGLVPEEYREEWSQTEAGHRRAALLEDVEALDKAVQSVTAAYEALIKHGKQVLDESNKPNLPSRARKVLDEAKDVPAPKTHAGRLIPGSTRVTYATVFAFGRVHELVRRWDEEMREKLAFAASLKSSS